MAKLLGARSLSAAAAAHRPNRASGGFWRRLAGWLAAAAAAAPRVAKAKAANLERRRSIHRFIASHNCLLAFTRSRLGWLGPTHFILINLFVAATFCVPSRLAHLITRASLPFLPSSRLSSVVEPSAVEQRRDIRDALHHFGHTTAAFHDRPFAHNSSSDASSGSSSDTTLPMASHASKRCRCCRHL